MRFTTEEFCKAVEKHGLRVNFGVEALLVLKGLLAKTRSKVSQELKIVEQYKHMGSMCTPSGAMGPEVSWRVDRTRVAYLPVPQVLPHKGAGCASCAGARCFQARQDTCGPLRNLSSSTTLSTAAKVAQSSCAGGHRCQRDLDAEDAKERRETRQRGLLFGSSR